MLFIANTNENIIWWVRNMAEKKNWYALNGWKKGKIRPDFIVAKKGIIYAIEEPETSQHPNNQKLIINALINLTKDVNRQVIITTHSPELLKFIEQFNPAGIRFVQRDSKDAIEIESGNDALILSASALGIFSKQRLGSSEKIVLVEGKNDCLFLEHASQVMKDAGELSKNLTEAKVEILPVGGYPGVKGWIEMNKPDKIGLKTFVFLDSDRADNSIQKTNNESFIESLNLSGKVQKAFCTKKREIENYIKKELTGCEFGDFDDVKVIVPLKTNIAKNQLIENYWVKMIASDMDEEIKSIINNILEN